jgi:hypothetical protein
VIIIVLVIAFFPEKHTVETLSVDSKNTYSSVKIKDTGSTQLNNMDSSNRNTS